MQWWVLGKNGRVRRARNSAASCLFPHSWRGSPQSSEGGTLRAFTRSRVEPGDPTPERTWRVWSDGSAAGHGNGRGSHRGCSARGAQRDRRVPCTRASHHPALEKGTTCQPRIRSERRPVARTRWADGARRAPGHPRGPRWWEHSCRQSNQTRPLGVVVVGAAGLSLGTTVLELSWIALFATAPGLALAAAIARRPPPATRLRTLGWTLVAASSPTELVLLVGLRST